MRWYFSECCCCWAILRRMNSTPDAFSYSEESIEEDFIAVNIDYRIRVNKVTRFERAENFKFKRSQSYKLKSPSFTCCNGENSSAKLSLDTDVIDSQAEVYLNKKKRQFKQLFRRKAASFSGIAQLNKLKKQEQPKQRLQTLPRFQSCRAFSQDNRETNMEFVKKQGNKTKALFSRRKSASFSDFGVLDKLLPSLTAQNEENENNNKKNSLQVPVLDEKKNKRNSIHSSSEKIFDDCNVELKSFRKSFSDFSDLKSLETAPKEINFEKLPEVHSDPIPRRKLKRHRRISRLRKQQDHCKCNALKVPDVPTYSCEDCENLKNAKEKSRSTENIPRESKTTLEDMLDGETEEDAEMRRMALRSRTRSRSSAVVQIPSASIQMDLHTLYLENISNKPISKKGKSLDDHKKKLQRGIAVFNATPDEDNEKKSRGFSILKLKLKKDDSNSIDDFRDFLEHLRSNLVEVFEHDLSIYKDSHWSTIEPDENHNRRVMPITKISEQERERYEALWELFYAEISYLLDHLLVLRNVFGKPLEHAQEFGFLTFVNNDILFANLESLIEVISHFAINLLKIFKSCGVSISESTEIIVDAFKEFDDVLTPQYKTYCLNYQSAKNHLNQLKEDEKFVEFLKWGEQDERCQRRKMEDFLVAPLQHLTKYPLLLKAIRKCTPKDDINNQLLTTTIFDIEQSIKSIEKKISSLVNLQRLQEIQECVVWPSIPDVDKSSIPDFVRSDIKNSQCEIILTVPNRVLLHEGCLTVADNNKSEFYVFLFDDMMLVTKYGKKFKRRTTEKRISETEMNSRKVSHNNRDSSTITQLIVHRQPIPLDRLKYYDCDDQSTGFKNAFCIVHYNRYHQAVAVYTFQTGSTTEKTAWMKNLKQARDYVISEAYSSSNKDVSSDEEYML